MTEPIPVPSDDEILERLELESDLATVALTAELHEWVTASIHKISALVVILGWWRTQMRDAQYTDEVIAGTMPMVLSRVWPMSYDDEDDAIEIVVD